MIVGSPIILNLVPGGVMKCVHVNQVNKNIEIQFKVMNGAAPYNMPEGVTCTIRGTKGDAFGYAAEAAVTVGSNVITVTLTEQLTAVAGAGNIFELVFVGAADDMKVSTENFILAVERQAMGEDTVISDSDLSYAEQVLDQLQSVGAVNAQVQQNKANLAAEISRAQAAEATEAAARQAADNTLQSNINAEASTRATTDASLQSQINQLIAPSGSAPSAAEVENARVGADGTVYPTLGDAIRTQVTDVKSALIDNRELQWRSPSTTRLQTEFIHITNRDYTITCASGYHFGVYGAFDAGSKWYRPSNNTWYTSSFNATGWMTSIKVSTLLQSTNKISIILEKTDASAIAISDGSAVTWLTYLTDIEKNESDISSLESDLNDIQNSKLPYYSKEPAGTTVELESDIQFPNVGRLATASGVIFPDTAGVNYRVSDYISLDNVVGIYRTGTTTMYELWTYCFYDANKDFLGSKAETTDYEIVTYKGKQVTWLDIDDYPNAKYVRITIMPTRPYTYHCVKTVDDYIYNVPELRIKGVNPLGTGKFYGKKIVNFGDSIFGNFRDRNETTDKSISKMIAEATGATVYNCGFGGCRMAEHSQYWRAFSMYALADAITTGDWTAQDEGVAADLSGMQYFAETLALLKSIDFSSVDYITIGYGTNDFSGNIFIDYHSGFAYYQYFKGALEYSLRTILNTYPNIRIIVITPCWRWWANSDTGLLDHDSDDPTAVNTRNLTLPDYVDACKEVCEKYHVPCIDTYTELGFNPYTYKAYFNVKGVDGATASDGTHPKQAGRQLRADRIVGQMESLY